MKKSENKTLLPLAGQTEVVIMKMDIEKLIQKRQLNVQEQNLLEEARILSEAAHWRENGLPNGLLEVLSAHSVDSETCLMFEYEQNFPGCSTDEGYIVTEDGQFIQFDMDLSEDREHLTHLHEWTDVTADFEILKSKPGTGATRGYLCLKVLGQLNQK